MKNFWKFVKSSGIYFLGTVMIKLVTFLLLPIYTAYISPTDLGTYDVMCAYNNFLCSVLFLDIWAGIMRYMYEYTTPEEKRKPVSCGLAIFGMSSGVYTIIMAVAGTVFHVPYIQYIYLTGLCSNLQNVYSYLARALGRNTLYAVSGMIGSILTTVLNVVLIVVFHQNYSVMFIASAIGFVINILIIEFGIHAHTFISFRDFDWALFRQMFRFSIPLCVNSMAYWFLSSYNRVAITHTLGTEANGLYSIASRFGSLITLFTSCFNMAWQEMAYAKEAAAKGKDGEFYTKAINSFIQFLGMGLLILIPAIYIIYPIMINGNYSEGLDMVPFYLAATMASAISGFLGNVFSAVKKNDILFFTTVIGSITNVIVVHLLLPVLGVQGASIGLFSGFLINIIIRLVVLSRELTFRLNVSFMVCLLAMFAGVCYVYFTRGMLWNAAVLVAMLVVTVLVFREYIVNIVKSIRNR